MDIQRLDNKRMVGQSDLDDPTISVTKSYAKLSPDACSAMEVVPGQSYIAYGVGFDNGKKLHILWKADDEKGGKKLSEASTIVSESIYGRLTQGATYRLGTPFGQDSIKYFPLEEIVAEAEEATPPPVATPGVAGSEAPAGWL